MRRALIVAGDRALVMKQFGELVGEAEAKIQRVDALGNAVVTVAKPKAHKKELEPVLEPLSAYDEALARAFFCSQLASAHS